MARVWRVGFFIASMAGLAACKASAQAPKSVVLNDFERAPQSGQQHHHFDPAEALRQPTYPVHDFDVATSGYAALEAVTKEQARAAKDKALYKFIQGKTAAKVRFTVPGDYRKKDEFFPKTWETGFGMSTESHTPLRQTDWSPYRYFDFRVFNPSDKVQHLFVRYNDSASAATITAVDIPQGESEVELPLEILAAARLNPADVRGFSLYLDSAAQSTDPVLLFDQIALYDTDAATRIKLAADEGADEENDDDWDSEDEDTVRKVNVVHPGDAVAAVAPLAVSPAAQ